jgi:predicted RNA-binding Zn-ribbon protein involved in translation (DUF1610 family)
MRLKDLDPAWHQAYVVRCPSCKECLLQSIYFHEMKCPGCGKYWVEKVELIETKRPEEEK